MHLVVALALTLGLSEPRPPGIGDTAPALELETLDGLSARPTCRPGDGPVDMEPNPQVGVHHCMGVITA